MGKIGREQGCGELRFSSPRNGAGVAGFAGADFRCLTAIEKKIYFLRTYENNTCKTSNACRDGTGHLSSAPPAQAKGKAGARTANRKAVVAGNANVHGLRSVGYIELKRWLRSLMALQLRLHERARI
jgi:hypothetical protein